MITICILHKQYAPKVNAQKGITVLLGLLAQERENVGMQVYIAHLVVGHLRLHRQDITL